MRNVTATHKHMRQRQSYFSSWLMATVCVALLVTATIVVSLFINDALPIESRLGQPSSKQTATRIGVLSSAASTAPPMRSIPQPTLTLTLMPTRIMTQHIVLAFETLGQIAEQYGITVDALAQANSIQNPNQIREGQVLTISVSSGLPLTRSAQVVVTTRATPALASSIVPTSVPTQSIEQKRFAILEGDLSNAYPLEKLVDRVRIHYQPGSYATNNLEQITRDVAEARALVLKTLNINFDDAFDLYLANYFFEPPNQHLRGRTFAPIGQVFVLFDGSGTPAERRYMLAHEFTHLIAWRSFGKPGSVMISEGLAVYAGQSVLPAESFISLAEFCLAYRRTRRLPLISSRFTTYLGHLYSLDAYYASGCFVQFLSDTYDVEKVGLVYRSLAFDSSLDKAVEKR